MRIHHDLPDVPKFQSEKEELYRPTNTESVDGDSYIDVVSTQTKDQIYTELDRNGQSNVYQSLTADSLHESIYHTIEHH